MKNHQCVFNRQGKCAECIRERRALIQNAVYGYVINMMDIPRVYRVGEEAYAKGEDVTAAIHALLDVIATKSEDKP